MQSVIMNMLKFREMIKRYEAENAIEKVVKESNTKYVVYFRCGLVKEVRILRKTTNEDFKMGCYRAVMKDLKAVDLSKLKEVNDCDLSVNFGTINEDDETEIYKVDINRCYFNVARKLGFISDENYEKYKDRQYKYSINIAIGCTASKTMVVTYDGDGKKKLEMLENPMAKIRANILDYVAKLYYEVAESTDVEYFHTDCFFIRNKDEIGVIGKILEKHGLTYKLE